MPREKKPVSNYTLLTRWLFDGSKVTGIPEDVVKDKSISQLYLLYYFQASHLNLYINQTFNNYNLFALDRVEVFKFLKQCVNLSGYKPSFVKKESKIKSKLVDALVSHYPYLKREEIFMLVEMIDASDEKDAVYEMFGFYKPKKKKITKAEKKRMEKETSEQKEKEVSLTDLMESFSV
jgi:hypothetical protein